MTGSVRVVGGLLPSDVLSAVGAGSLDGLSSGDYHLAGEAPREAAARQWSYLTGVYRQFRDDLARLPEGDAAIGVTRERWLTAVLSALGYGRVPATPQGGLAAGDRQYPVSHLWGACPIHLLGWGVDLDHRSPGVAGAAQRAPHAMVQELLNRQDAYLWAIVSNGRVLRLLRDSTTLAGQAYVEFDLESMFDAELFADFATLFLLAHESRVEVPEGGRLADCWLERWRTTAVSQGVRALALLRGGVQEALQTLGTGFLQHPANRELRDGLDSGSMSLGDLHQNLLRIVYRVLFWAVAEDRDALLDRDADREAVERYRRFFSSARLREMARRRHGSAHHDLWDGAQLVLDALGGQGDPRLALPGLGGLFAGSEADVLAGAKLGNHALLAAVRALSIVQPKGQPRRVVDFRHLGAEELGSIYESLLELVPRRDPLAQTFTLEAAAGNDRKTSGSYYTPSELVELVLDTALDPVLDEAEKQDDREAALLGVTCCDPAIGSGHFMVAAARRIATRLAIVRTGEIDPTPEMFTNALHDVVATCIYGVDVNPMAADLAKVSLWLEAMTPGRPLSFLDHHIKVGNALLGTTPALLAQGIPDAAYVALTGDDKKTVSSWKKINAQQRAGQEDLFADAGISIDNTAQRLGVAEINKRATGAASLADIAWAAQRYRTLQSDPDTVRARRVADAWCAAFLTPKTPNQPAITQATLDQLSTDIAPPELLQIVDQLAARHRLFHWHLEFPDIFRTTNATDTGWIGGFSTMLGNPPWETLQMSEKEFFATRESKIADAPNAATRKRMISDLETSNPALHGEFEFELRRGAAETHLIRGGRYPLCAIGKINTYSIFAEHFRASIAWAGRTGVITPTGLATDATTSAFFADTLRSDRLAAFYDFDNEAKIFSNVHHAFRFAISSMTGGEPTREVRLSFINREVKDANTGRFAVASEEVLLLNPNTGTLPILRRRRDAEIAISCYKKHPILIRDDSPDGNPWGLRLTQGLFNMASDSQKFLTPNDLEVLSARFDGRSWVRGSDRWFPLYEAKMFSHWNHRYATYSGATQAQLNQGILPRLSLQQLQDMDVESLPRYWVSDGSVAEAMPANWNREWLLCWRKITGAQVWRTMVPSTVPALATGDSCLVALPRRSGDCLLLQSIWSSLIFDYLVRQKVSGSNLQHFILKQIACPSRAFLCEKLVGNADAADFFLEQRAAELAYSSTAMSSFIADVLGDTGLPFQWATGRRAQLSAEIDAAMMHIYDIGREDAEYVLDSFGVLRNNDERDFGEFRTKRLVLAEYDAMATAAEAGVPYESPLDPPPGHGPRHAPRTS